MVEQSSVVTRVCSVCKSDDFVTWYRPEKSPGPVVQCRKCGFVYVNPIENTHSIIQAGPVLDQRSERLLTSSNLEDIKGSWEEEVINRYMGEAEAKKANARDLVIHIERHMQGRGNILDIGCFCGVFLSVAKQAGWDCFGVEPLVMPAIYARASFGLNVITDTLRNETFPPNFFDVVTAQQVMEHIAEPENEIRKYWRILKPGGLIVIEVPNIDTAMVKLLGPRHRHYVQDHVSFFSKDTLSSLLTREGFEICEVFLPSRSLSMHQLSLWIGTYSTFLAKIFRGAIPSGLLWKAIRLNFRDIVTVIGKKK